MNLNIIRRSLCGPRWNTHFISVCQFSKLETFNKYSCVCVSSSLTSKNGIRNQNFALQIRNCSSSGVPSSKRLPALMKFPEVTWPSVVKSIRNFIMATFIIRPYFDKDFSLPEFVVGSKKALEVVSHMISEGDFKSLNGFVTSEAIPTIQKSISEMSLSQRELLSINKDDIYFSFPYQVGVMFNDDDSANQKRFVEITMVYHTLKGLSAMRSRGEDPPLNMGMVPEYQHRISICNYRFIREFSKGVESEWTINLLNHFKPADHLDE